MGILRGYSGYARLENTENQMKYQSKPVQIDAMQYTGTNLAECRAWVAELALVSDGLKTGMIEPIISEAHHTTTIKVFSLQGWVNAVKGDWLIIPSNRREIYPCKPVEFEQRYECLTEPEPAR